MASEETSMPEYGAEIRKLFMLREGSVCLNHGSYGSVPREVHEQQVKLLKEMESHPDTWFRYSLEKHLTKAVVNLSEFLHTGPHDTFFLQNATKAINTVLKTYPLKPGDAYLITDLSYSAVIKTTYVSSNRVQGAKTYIMDFKIPIEREEDVVEKYESFFKEHKDVKIAVLDHISSPTPMVHPVKKLVEVCHRHGVISVIDGAHAPGQIPLDLPDIDSDFYAGNLHKWLFTPRGCGFIWMNPKRKKDWFKPLVTSSFDGSGLHIEFGYEGTKDDTPYICSIYGSDFFKKKLGSFEKTVPYAKQMREKAIPYLEERWGTKRLAIPENMVAPYMQMVKLPYLKGFSDDPDDQSLPLMTYLLDRFDIQVAVACIQGELYARLSFPGYVVFEDVVKLADAVETLHKESTECSAKALEENDKLKKVK